MMIRAILVFAFAFLIGSIEQVWATHAGATYTITIDTSAVTGSVGAIALDFTSNTPNDNSVSILSFSHDGTTGLPETQGGLISGDIILLLNPAPFTQIADGSFFNSLVVPFDSFGSQIIFSLQITENAALPSEIPDQFSFYVLGPDRLPPFGTLDPLGTDALFTISVDGSPQGLLGVFDPTMSVDGDQLGITVPCVLANRLISGQVITDTRTFVACNVLTVVDTQVLGGNVTFLAGEAVVLGEDFVAGFPSGGQLSIVIDPSLIP